MPTLGHKIFVRKRKKIQISRSRRFMESLEEWVSYWRANPHRFATEYLGLKLYDFQKVLIYQMFKSPLFLFVASNRRK